MPMYYSALMLNDRVDTSIPTRRFILSSKEVRGSFKKITRYSIRQVKGNMMAR